MRVSFLFWNVRGARKQGLLDSVTRLAGLGIHVFLFAEGPGDPGVLLTALNAGGVGPYHLVPSQSKRVLYYSCLQGAVWTDQFYDVINDRLTVQELQLDQSLGILVVGAHLNAPSHMSLVGRAEWARDVAADIRRIEEDVKHSRTFIVGDLNMNPFDGGLVETTALHAVMSKELARSVQGLEARKAFRPFYNPMWSCFGDREASGTGKGTRRRPPGTYFYPNTADRASHFWNIYDQVLLRPDLMDNLLHLEVLDTDGEKPLVTAEGRPRVDALTDHLPILFELEL